MDVMVDDRSAAHEQVLALGARRLTPDGAQGDVYADPAGHPFCLIDVPSWAPPVQGPDRPLTAERRTLYVEVGRHAGRTA